ncbi:endonuclease/exonuclease/phosphatase family protein [Winogradskyella sp.]|uniref:endonuclease/exonuclease/phosphatase family protein n=1 Tax=Winogradskyella sp. TaxID=1883156 RepID=UPI002618FCB7|nr:endonuclease/exonuclease/phosphatase family protein [Winogradskyella sp.]
MNSRYIHIGAWNIEHFGNKEDSNDENQYALAEHIELAGVDVLAMQELYITDIGNFTNNDLEKALELVQEHTGHKWKYEIFQNRNPEDTSQLCGIAWNDDRVKKVGETYPINVDYTIDFRGETLWLWDRRPHAIKFSAGEGKTDFAVVSLHMKANTGSPYIDRKKRHAEVMTLLDELSNIKKTVKEEDIIFLGDTNCKGRSEDAIRAFVEAGFDDLNEDDTTTYVKGNSAPFDRIFVPRTEQSKTFKYSRQYVMKASDHLAHDKYLSDHYVIKTSIKVRTDND